MAVYSRQLFHAELPNTTPNSEGSGPPAGSLWIVKGIGVQVPAGGRVGIALPGWAAGALADVFDNAGGATHWGFSREYFHVLEPGQTLGYGWQVNPGGESAWFTVSGYLLPYP